MQTHCSPTHWNYIWSVCKDYEGYLPTFYIKYDFIHADLWNTSSSRPNVITQAFCSSFPPFSMECLAQIFLLITVIIKRHFSQYFSSFSQGIANRERRKKQTSIYNCESRFLLFYFSLGWALLIPYVRLLSQMQYSISWVHIYIYIYIVISSLFFLSTLFIMYSTGLYGRAHTNGDVIKNMSFWWRAKL